MRGNLFLPILFAVLALAACASQPRIALTNASTAPISPASYRFAQSGAVEQAVAARLAALGYTEAPEGSAATYRIDAAYAVRPLAVGALVPGDTAANAPKAVLAEPAELKRWPKSWDWRERQAYTLVVDISDTATGKSVYRVRAETDATAKQAEGIMLRLAEAALVRLPLPAQTPR